MIFENETLLNDLKNTLCILETAITDTKSPGTAGSLAKLASKISYRIESIEKIREAKKSELMTSSIHFLGNLCGMFPQVFDEPFGNDKKTFSKVLAIGTFEDIRDAFPDIPQDVVRNALNYYTSRFQYLNAILDGKPRVKFPTGEIVGYPTEGDKSSTRLKARNISKRIRENKKAG